MYHMGNLQPALKAMMGNTRAGCFGNAEDYNAKAYGRLVIILEQGVGSAQEHSWIRTQALEVCSVCRVAAHEQYSWHLCTQSGAHQGEPRC